MGWTLGMAVLGVVYGSIANSIGDLLSDNPQLATIFERAGEQIVDTYFATVLGILALVAAAYAIRTALRLRVEEENVRADPILATATSRFAFMSSHLSFAFVGSGLMLVMAATVAGLTYASISGGIGDRVLSVVEAGLLYVPAVWVVAALSAALYGLSPRLSQATWGALVLFLVFGQLGAILQLPQWMLNLSPFTHVPAALMIDAQPIAWLLALALMLLLIGTFTFARRDLA
jgi:ABC-2 type transport system permease protein